MSEKSKILISEHVDKSILDDLLKKHLVKISVILDKYSPFISSIKNFNSYKMKYDELKEYGPNGQFTYRIFANQQITSSEIRFFLFSLLSEIRAYSMRGAFEKINAIFSNIEPCLSIADYRNENSLNYTIQIEDVYEGSYLDYSNIKNLKKINIKNYKPDDLENFSILIKFKVSFLNTHDKVEYFYYTLCSPNQIVKFYKSKLDTEKILLTFKGIAQEKYSFLKMQEMLFNYLNDIEGATKNEIMIKLSGFLDYPLKNKLLKENVFGTELEAFELKIENSRDYFSKGFWD